MTGGDGGGFAEAKWDVGEKVARRAGRRRAQKFLLGADLAKTSVARPRLARTLCLWKVIVLGGSFSCYGRVLGQRAQWRDWVQIAGPTGVSIEALVVERQKVERKAEDEVMIVRAECGRSGDDG